MPNSGRPTASWRSCATARSSVSSPTTSATPTWPPTSSGGTASWDEHATLPDEDDVAGYLRAGPSTTFTVEETGRPRDGVPATARSRASYSRPFLAHASIAPSCGLARWDGDDLHVWSHSQNIFGLRAAVAQALHHDAGPHRGRARRECRRLRAQRRGRRGLRRGAARACRARSAGAGALEPRGRAVLVAVRLAAGGRPRCRARRGRPDRQLGLRRVEPGAHRPAGLCRHPRPARRGAPRGSRTGARPGRPGAGPRGREHARSRAVVRRASAADPRPSVGTGGVAYVVTAFARRVHQRLRASSVSSTSWPRSPSRIRSAIDSRTCPTRAAERCSRQSPSGSVGRHARSAATSGWALRLRSTRRAAGARSLPRSRQWPTYDCVG